MKPERSEAEAIGTRDPRGGGGGEGGRGGGASNLTRKLYGIVLVPIFRYMGVSCRIINRAQYTLHAGLSATIAGIVPGREVDERR
jgi:hypothetical protein